MGSNGGLAGSGWVRTSGRGGGVQATSRKQPLVGRGSSVEGDAGGGLGRRTSIDGQLGGWNSG
eukprot:1160482-Pelagomonas_calceolata.AAC.3